MFGPGGFPRLARYGGLSDAFYRTADQMVARNPPQRSEPPPAQRVPFKSRNDTQDIKDEQAWMHPSGKVERAPSTNINGNLYYDPKDYNKTGDMVPRRKHETNLFLTMNTNKTVKDARRPEAERRMAQVLNFMGERATIGRYLEFGPVDNVSYGNDVFEDVVSDIDWFATQEYGGKRHRLHAHAHLTITHHSQIQVKPYFLQMEFKSKWNNVYPPLHYDDPLYIKGMPNTQVKLQHQRAWPAMMRLYMVKARSLMTAEGQAVSSSSS